MGGKKSLTKKYEILWRTKENLELKNTITEIQNLMDGLNSRMEEAEERISELEDRAINITQTKKNREKID